MKEADKILEPQLWHACAGGMVKIDASRPFCQSEQ